MSLTQIQSYEETGPAEALRIGDRPQDVLRKIMSLTFVMTESSSLFTQYHEARRRNAAKKHHDFSYAQGLSPSPQEKPLLCPVGRGSCGDVYAQLGMTHVLKRAINGNTSLSEKCRLENDFIVHQAVEEAFSRVAQWGIALRLRIPRLYSYMSRSDRSCWSTHARLFSELGRTPEDLLLSERIPPMYPAARQALINLYCPQDLKAGARLHSSNDDCLVRLYLGKRHDQTTRLQPRRLFGLWNFPLYLDQMQALGLDTTQYAFVMAEALAVMHWEAKIDAADVEFVLGGRPCLTHVPLPSYAQLLASTDRSVKSSGPGSEVTHIWLLDFNQCQSIQMNELGVDQAVKRFFDNDPYYPRPAASFNRVDTELWEAFESQYRKVSQEIVGDGENTLPGLFIDKVKQANLSRERTRAEAAERSDKDSAFEAEENRYPR